MSRLLIIDDEPKMTMMIANCLSEAGHSVDTAASGKEAMEKLRKTDLVYDLVVTDIRLPAPDGMKILSWIMENRADTIVVMMTAFAEVKTAVEAMKTGAADYLIKPFPLEELVLQVSRLLNQRRAGHLGDLRERDYKRLAYDDFIGQSPAATVFLDLVRKVAASDTSVLISGESGSGKELAARMIHDLSPRKHKPFIAVNCAALTETLLDSELFGHEKGAFTGAVARKPGRFELADGGTVFLDEIGEMSPALQAKILRVLEEKVVTRVGGVGEVAIDIRLLTATNRILEDMVEEGSFRSDLYFRINVFPIVVPPLRERVEDIPPLAEYFLKKNRYPHPQLDDRICNLLKNYRWPGNVRELKNILDRAVILSEGNRIEPEHINIKNSINPSPGQSIGTGNISLGETEKSMILQALKQANDNKTRAAELLGITRRRLYSRMKVHGIKP